MDPVLLASSLTVNTYSFGISSYDLKIAGIVMITLGTLLLIQPSLYLHKMRKRENDLWYLRVSRKQQSQEQKLNELVEE